MAIYVAMTPKQSQYLEVLMRDRVVDWECRITALARGGRFHEISRFDASDLIDRLVRQPFKRKSYSGVFRNFGGPLCPDAPIDSVA